MINEGKKSRGQEGKLVNPSPLPSPTRGEGVTCHPELVSGSHKFTSLQTLSRICKFAYCSLTNSTLSQRERVCSKTAFTLAEVLITLGIIGIVAAMTMPSLIQKHEQKVLLNQFKKTYAILNQAVLSMKAKYDNVDPVDMPFVHSVWNHRAYLDSSLFGPEFAQHVAVLWHGPDPQTRLCFPDISKFNYKSKNGGSIQPQYLITQTGNNYTWQLKDGACVEFAYGRNWEWDGRDKRSFVIDVNGSNKGPNRLGRDVYFFYFEPDGKIVPWGADDTEQNQYNNCRGYGSYCAALIVKNGMQYPKNYPW